MSLNILQQLWILPGGLISPSDEFIAIVRKWDVIFASMHSDIIDHDEWVLNRLRDAIVKEFPNFPLPIIERYTKFRTFSRKNLLEFERKEAVREELKAKAEKRKAKAVEKAVAEAAEKAAAEAAENPAAGEAPSTSPSPSTSGASAGPSRPIIVEESAQRRNRRKQSQFAGRK